MGQHLVISKMRATATSNDLARLIVNILPLDGVGVGVERLWGMCAEHAIRGGGSGEATGLEVIEMVTFPESVQSMKKNLIARADIAVRVAGSVSSPASIAASESGIRAPSSGTGSIGDCDPPPNAT